MAVVDCKQYARSGSAAVGVPDQRRHRGVRRSLEPDRPPRHRLRRPPLFPGAAGRLNRGDRLKYSRRPAQATRQVGTAHPRGHATRPAGTLQPDRTRDPARTRVRAARQLGTSPPAHELRAERSRRAARTRRPRALAGVHARAAPLAPWLRYLTAITERSRAPERGLPRCYQLLVAARQPAMSKGWKAPAASVPGCSGSWPITA